MTDSEIKDFFENYSEDQKDKLNDMLKIWFKKLRERITYVNKDKFFLDEIDYNLFEGSTKEYINFLGLKVKFRGKFERENEYCYYRYSILNFPDYFIECSGTYDSWNGPNWEFGEIYMVRKTQILVDYYENI